MGLSKRASDHGKILAEDKNLSAVNSPVSSDDAITQVLFVLPEMTPSARLQNIELFKGTFIQQQIDPFLGAEFTPLVLLGNLLLPTPCVRFFTHLPEPDKIVLKRGSLRAATQDLSRDSLERLGQWVAVL
jgi:hypothetical protein